MKRGNEPLGHLVHTIRDNCAGTTCHTIGHQKQQAPAAKPAKADPVQAKWARRRQAKALDVKVSSNLFAHVRALADVPGPYQSHYRDWAKRYSASLFCCHTIHYHDAKAESGRYCGAKWCRVCSRIRAGVNHHNYGAQLVELPHLHFVTLTTGPRVTATQLAATIDGMVAAWRKIYRALRERGHRLVGYRKMEITYDPTTATYHPHFHILISGIGPATGLQSLWMKQHPNASQAGQHCQVVLDSNRAAAVVEIMKYTNKTADHKALMDAEALHTINVATFGRQMFCPFGMKKQAKADPVPATALDDVRWLPKRTILFAWDDAAGNWVDTTDAALAFVAYIPGILDAIQAPAKVGHGPP